MYFYKIVFFCFEFKIFSLFLMQNYFFLKIMVWIMLETLWSTKRKKIKEFNGIKSQNGQCLYDTDPGNCVTGKCVSEILDENFYCIFYGKLTEISVCFNENSIIRASQKINFHLNSFKIQKIFYRHIFRTRCLHTVYSTTIN